jgi:hypothetical protein
MSRRYKIFFRKVASLPFTFYKLILSPLLPAACLYKPTCSEYFRQSILRFGILKGFLLGISRLLRCNGWFFKGGDDMVPEFFSLRTLMIPYRTFSKFKYRTR